MPKDERTYRRHVIVRKLGDGATIERLAWFNGTWPSASKPWFHTGDPRGKVRRYGKAAGWLVAGAVRGRHSRDGYCDRLRYGEVFVGVVYERQGISDDLRQRLDRLRDEKNAREAEARDA